MPLLGKNDVGLYYNEQKDEFATEEEGIPQIDVRLPKLQDAPRKSKDNRFVMALDHTVTNGVN